jgi:hypothetical protein
VRILGTHAVEPRPVHPSEVPEMSRRAIERLVQETDVSPCASTDCVPAELSLVEEIDLQGARDIIGAVAVGRVRSRPLRVLHDPDLVAQDVKVHAAHGMERLGLKH